MAVNTTVSKVRRVDRAPNRVALLVGAACIGAAALTTAAHAQYAELPQTLRSTQVPVGHDDHGGAIVVSDGEVFRGGLDPATSQNAINVYDAQSGVYLRSIIPPSDLDSFARVGDQLVVSAGTIATSFSVTNFDGFGSQPAVLLFNAATGALTQRIEHLDPRVLGDVLGDRIAMTDTAIAYVGSNYVSAGVGVWKHVHVFDRATGDFLYRIDHPAPLDRSSYFVAMELTNEHLVVATRDRDDASLSEIAVYDALTGAPLATHENVESTFMEQSRVDVINGALYFRVNRGPFEDIEELYVYDPPTSQTPHVITLEGSGARLAEGFQSNAVTFGDYIAIGHGDGGDPVPGDAIAIVDPRTGATVRLLRLGSNENPPFSRFLQSDGHRLYAYETDESDTMFSFDLDDICFADLEEPFGELNFFDLGIYFTNFSQPDPIADIAAPFGTLNFFDIAEYIARFNAGCP